LYAVDLVLSCPRDGGAREISVVHVHRFEKLARMYLIDIGPRLSEKATLDSCSVDGAHPSKKKRRLIDVPSSVSEQ
jgi:hypothetical protein